MRFPSHEVFQQRLRGWGVNDDSNIVLYDDSRTELTSRVYFMLELYGFHMARVQILDGGTLEWSAFNDLEKDPVERQPGRVTLKPANPDFLVELGRRADPAGRRGR
jgi:thiosulfate/3-mercaptopyruvate sulfurtransferase